MPEGRSKRPAGATAVLCARQPFRAAEPAAADGGELARRVRLANPDSLASTSSRAALPERQRCGLVVRSECAM